MAGAVAGAVARIAGMVKDGLAHALGIHSPSDVTMEMGSMLGQGLILGLMGEDVPGQVAKHLAAVSGAATGSVAIGVSGGGSVSGGSGAGGIGSFGVARAMAAAGSSVGGAPVYLNIHIAGTRVAQVLLPDMVSEIRRATGGQGV